MTNELTLNGVKYDLTKKEDVEMAIKAVKESPESVETGISFIDTFISKFHDRLLNALNERLEKFDDKEKDVNWLALGIDWENDSHCVADTYLSTIEGYEDQTPEAQARQIKTLADFYDWLNKE